ncbi:hypothetical protein H9P43_008545 [Blastocladiella emersonii ATCC 22665]|nr:hypothetical protein H9P43_008545 [Blastocladiella emersonii ATCC 22665]
MVAPVLAARRGLRAVLALCVALTFVIVVGPVPTLAQNPGNRLPPTPSPAPPGAPAAPSAPSAPVNTTADIVIKIGLVMPLSNPEQVKAELATTGKQAIELALRQIDLPITNNSYVSNARALRQRGVTFELIVADTYKPNASLDFILGRDRPLPLSEAKITSANLTAQSIVSTFDLIRQGAVALIGDQASATTTLQAQVSSRLMIPQCSFSAAHPDLAIKDLYPYFFRTIPSSKALIEGFFRFLEKNNLNRFALLYSLETYGSGFAKAFLSLVADYNAKNAKTGNTLSYDLFTFWEQGETSNLTRSLNAIRASPYSVVLVASVNEPQKAIVNAIVENRLFLQHDLAWVFINEITTFAAAAFNKTTPYGPAPPSIVDYLKSSASPLLGSFYLTPLSGSDSAAFQTFQSLWTANNHSAIAHNEPFAFDCAAVLIEALANYVLSSSPNPADQLATARALAAGRYPRGPLRLADLNAVRANGAFGIINFNEMTGEPEAGFEVYNWQSNGPARVRRNDSSLISDANKWESMVFPNGESNFNDQSSSAKITIEIDTMAGTVLAVCCALGVVVSLGFLVIVILNRHTPTIRAISPVFCALVLVGLALMYVAIGFQLAVYGDTMCNVTPVTSVIALGLVIGNIIAKNQRIWQLFGSPLLFRNGLPDHKIMRISLTIVLVDTILAVAWVVTKPFKPVVVSSRTSKYQTCLPITGPVTANGSVFKSLRNTDDTLPSLYESPVFVLICVFNGALLIYASVLAWNTRRIPIRGYNESRAIALSIYNIMLGGAILLPTFFPPVNALYQVAFGLRSMVMLFCATFALFVFFLPPIYLLWLDRSQGDSINITAPMSNDRGNNNTGDANPNSGIAYVSGTGSGVDHGAGTKARSRSNAVGEQQPGSDVNVDRLVPLASVPYGSTVPATTGPAGSGTLRHRGPGRHTRDPLKITHRPETGSETLEGVLVMKRSHRITSVFQRMFGRVLNRWQIVYVTLVPHQRLLTVVERDVKAASGGDAITSLDPRHGGAGAMGEPTEYHSFVYVAVRGPMDAAREQFQHHDRMRATHLLPSRSLYENTGGGSADPAQHHQQAMPMPPALTPPAPAYASLERTATASSMDALPRLNTKAGIQRHASVIDFDAATPPPPLPSNVKVNPCQFVVCTMHYDYLFETETPEETTQWVAVLKRALVAGGNTHMASGGGGGGPPSFPEAA